MVYMILNLLHLLHWGAQESLRLIHEDVINCSVSSVFPTVTWHSRSTTNSYTQVSRLCLQQTVTPRSVAYAYSIYVEENESNIGKKDHAEAFYIERMESELKGWAARS